PDVSHPNSTRRRHRLTLGGIDYASSFLCRPSTMKLHVYGNMIYPFRAVASLRSPRLPEFTPLRSHSCEVLESNTREPASEVPSFATIQTQ
ncbi:MAG: hypothetical protein KDB23_26525, partial [Planctomycetales bacterium]|nr:hypothetical protein [Planctomycetales bacterium]